ncbi:hypothetical protein E1218_07595 [Kribbella turkmenica]|uniref:PIN domain-containing protein n=2 Tax=Kribbella turkmenica TaxID=2530375 RepID=A0A4R4XCK6_9ACTN|nr:hypothetical protein E1218_07595 [Kribbella turkmenica]
MLSKVLPGTDRKRLLETLSATHANLQNTRSAGHTIRSQYDAYIDWANQSTRLLRSMISAADLDRLILTRRYWALQTMLPMETGDPKGRLLTTEVDERLLMFEDEIRELTTLINRWMRPGRFVVADTTLFCEHEQKLEALDLSALTKSWDEPVHLVLPIVVIDELDSLKRSGKPHKRWRAGYTLAVIDRVLGGGGLEGRLHEADRSPREDGESPRGAVTIELVLDPPGHSRLPINDDEIIDRAQAIQTLAGRNIKFITFDTSQSMRARTAGLDVVKLDTPRSTEEPPRT